MAQQPDQQHRGHETLAVEGRALIAIVDELATDVARLRRRAEPGSSLDHLADRLTSLTERLDCIVQPCAHDLYIDFFCISGDHQVALEDALRVTGERQRSLRHRLGLNSDGHRPTPALELVETQAA